jgi:hypothetical protein
MQSRITITIPQDLVAAADQKALTLDRSRSWVLVEALRQYLRTPGRVSEPGATYSVGIGPYRQSQLEADIALTPEQRVREAERTARSVPSAHQSGPNQFLSFDSYESYLDWKRRQVGR